jgi:xylulokinase
MPLVAGVDSSTQSTKVALRDVFTGQVVGTGRADHPAAAPPRSEQAPSAWWAALVDAMAQALTATDGRAKPADIGAIAVAAQQHGLVVLDSGRQVMRPAKLWNDTESAEDSDRLISRLGADRWVDACGSVPGPSFTVSKLAWLGRNEPETFARISHVLLPHDWLTFRLTGQLVTDRGDASGTGYWSPAENRYRPDLLSLVDSQRDWAATLPTVLGPWEQAGTLSRAAADQLGLPVDTPVAAGTGDNMAGALGAGLRLGEVGVSIGTSGTVFSPCDQPCADPTGTIAGFADATGRFLPLVCTLNGALVTESIARILAVDHSGLDRLALAAPSGSGGLVLVPYLAGERTPNRPDATGTLSGIRTDVTREQLARAAFEGVVCSLLDGLEALAAAGVPTSGGRLVLLGGGARSAGYRHVLASLSGRSVTVPTEDELVSAGAALQAGVLVTDTDAEVMADAWGLRQGRVTDPDMDGDSSGVVRRRFAAAIGDR